MSCASPKAPRQAIGILVETHFGTAAARLTGVNAS